MMKFYLSKRGKVAKITINRPHVHNAFTPKTVMEMIDAFNISRDKEDVGVIILTGAVTKHSVLVAIKKFEVMVDTLAKTTFHV